MFIGIFSDVHDNIANLRNMMSIYKDRNVKILIFCGDFCSPIPSRILGEFEGEVHCVFGNGDGDRYSILNIVNTTSQNVKLHGEHAELELDGNKIAVTHYPFYAKALARTGDYNAVFSGHTHAYNKELIGNCLWLNPGEVMGHFGDASCAIYDTSSNEVERIDL